MFTSFALSFAILSLYISLYIISFCTIRTRDVLKYTDIQQKLWTSVNLELMRVLVKLMLSLLTFQCCPVTQWCPHSIFLFLVS